MSQGQRIGQLLRKAGLVTEDQLEEALAEHRTSGVRLGEVLVQLGHVSEFDLTQLLSNQLSVAWVSLRHVDFTPELLSLVPRQLAVELTVVPVHFRLGREKQKIVYVAMDDPTNIAAMERISRATGMHVRPLIAPPSEIRDTIVACYGESDHEPD